MDHELMKPCSEQEIADALNVVNIFIGAKLPSYDVIRRLAFERGTLIRQRDELLAACELAISDTAIVSDNGKYATVQISSGVLEEVKAAIKKAKG